MAAMDASGTGEEMACQQPPWGEIVAINVNTGDIAWREPLGSFDELDARRAENRYA